MNFIGGMQHEPQTCQQSPLQYNHDMMIRVLYDFYMDIIVYIFIDMQIQVYKQGLLKMTNKISNRFLHKKQNYILQYYNILIEKSIMYQNDC